MCICTGKWVNGKSWYKVIFSRYGNNDPTTLISDDPWEMDEEQQDELGYDAEFDSYHPHAFGWTQVKPYFLIE